MDNSARWTEIEILEIKISFLIALFHHGFKNGECTLIEILEIKIFFFLLLIFYFKLVQEVRW